MTMSLIAGVAAFVLTVLAMPHFITYYKIKKIGGQQMHEDVKQHLAKAGTQLWRDSLPSGCDLG